MIFNAHDLVVIFAQTLGEQYRTRLVPGGDEPLYRPAAGADADSGTDSKTDSKNCHEIIFRHDYFQSALHELAHWCIAGADRRQQPDYGYWYRPDTRTAPQQTEFEHAEARPQAVEWLLTAACGKPFRVSLDNLAGGDPLDEGSLWRAVYGELQRCLAGAMPPRAAILARALAMHYNQSWPLPADYFVVPVFAGAVPGTVVSGSTFSGNAVFGGTVFGGAVPVCGVKVSV